MVTRAMRHSIAACGSGPVNAPWSAAASAMDPEMRNTSNPKTVRPLIDTFRLKSCISVDPSHATVSVLRRLVPVVLLHTGLVQHDTQQPRRIKRAQGVF